MQNKQTEFGHKLLKEFSIDPNYININAGSYGIVPNKVKQQKFNHLTDAEQNIQRWMFTEAEKRLSEVREITKNYINAKSKDDIVLVENAADGFNAVIKAFEIYNWQEKDVILSTNITYKMVNHTINYVIQQYENKISNEKVELNVKNIQSTELMLQAWKDKVEEIKSKGLRVKVAVIDHISSTPAILFPIKELTAYLKSENIIVIIDGAHAIGHIPIDIIETNADFYFSNFHKWFYTPRSVAFLWVNPIYQSKVHPTVISNFYGQGFQKEFYWIGTVDITTKLCVKDAYEFRQSLGEQELQEYKSNLSLKINQEIPKLLETNNLVENVIEQKVNMPTIRLPTNDFELCQKIQKRMFEEDNLFFVTVPFDNKCYVRFSVQIINEYEDFYNATKIFLKYLKEYEQEKQN